MAQGTGGEFRYPHSVAAILQQLRLTIGDEAQRAVGDTAALLDDRDRWVEDNFAALSAGGFTAASVRVPSGALMDFAGAIAPEGWVVCDGSAYSRTDQADLFAAIGTAWGAGDGSTSFNVPDLRGRTTIGAGSGAGLTGRTVGQRAGEETHALTAVENGAHTHSGVVTGLSQAPIYQSGSTINGFNSYTDGISNVSGSGAGHNNMQPFGVVSKIIKL